jgi:crotonobetainyl-CoA:carnitine CoA-transferase CaiB-like acyl-CoA transferase
MPGPLAGIKVLDLTSVLVGPYCTQVLAEMGAEITKVEPPEGDIVRLIGPQRHPGMGCMFLTINRGKRSIVLDLKRPEARAVLLKLATTADVLVTNIRPAAMARLGLDWPALQQANPALVYAAIVGFGQDGPYAPRPAYDDLMQGAALIAGLYARANDGEPRYAPLAMADRITGLMAVGAINAALFHRARCGEGQLVEIPMFETMVAFVLGDHMGGKVYDPPLDGGGYQRHLSPDRKPYRTKDGYVCTMIYNDRQWRNFCQAVGWPDLVSSDPRFASHATRTRHIDEILAMVAAEFVTRTTAEWLELLAAADCPVTPVHTLESIFEDPHLLASGFFTTEQHPTEGTIKGMAIPFRYSATPTGARRPAPRLGGDTAEILSEAGFDAAAIDALLASGAVSAA